MYENTISLFEYKYSVMTTEDRIMEHVYRLFISVFNQLDAQNLFHNKFYFMPLHVSSYTPIGVMIPESV